mgnify:CR=1 FL=1
MFIRFLLKNYNKNFLVFLLYFTTTNYCNSSDQIEVIKIFPPKCTILKDSKTLLCPRIMEIEIKINNNKNQQLISCILLSEEDEILAFGENILSHPGGKIYLTIREMRRKINEMKLIASSKCTINKKRN